LPERAAQKHRWAGKLVAMSDWFERFGFGEIADGLVTGAYPVDTADVEALARDGVTAVFNLCQDVEYGEDGRAEVEEALHRAGITERRIEITDYGDVLPGHLERASDAVLTWLDAGERVYVHCRAGWQRSSAVAAAVLARREGVDVDEALRRIRARRPEAEPLPHQVEGLRRWWRLRAARG
jgi:protein-tyrosine phosphatase